MASRFLHSKTPKKLTEYPKLPCFLTDKGGIQCCLGEGKGILPSEWLNDKCIPISVPDDDQFYRCHGIKCLNFVRSVTTPRDDCSLGHAEQVSKRVFFFES